MVLIMGHFCTSGHSPITSIIGNLITIPLYQLTLINDYFLNQIQLTKNIYSRAMCERVATLYHEILPLHTKQYNTSPVAKVCIHEQPLVLIAT